MIPILSAAVYAFLMGAVIVFQGCLAAGMPWGAASMGGKFPGKYPPKMRIIAVVNMAVLILLILIVMTKAGMVFSHLHPLSRYAIWFVVAFSALSVLMNTITPSKIERALWAPVTVVHLITSVIIALH